MDKLEFQHFVIDKLGIVFGSARDERNRVYNFLINTQTGGVLQQVNARFEAISSGIAEIVRTRMEKYQSVVPTYRIEHFDFN